MTGVLYTGLGKQMTSREPLAPNTELLCRDCVYARRPRLQAITDTVLFIPQRLRAHTYKCTAPQALDFESVNVVTGDIALNNYRSCTSMRYAYQPCGPQARLWRPRDTRQVFLALKYKFNEPQGTDHDD